MKKRKKSPFKQGFFKALNKNKYVGDASNIVYRSSYEFKLMSALDRNPNVLKWSSETIVVPYFNPIKNRIARYFVDFWVRQLVEDKIVESLIEVKPRHQVIEPKAKPKGQHTKTYIKNVETYVINKAKWKAARKYCAEKGWTFEILTEIELGIKR